jgi:tryptophanyl-tRNA synthetase
MTDPKRIKRTDPGTPEVCNIFHLHKAFSPAVTVEHVATQCSTAGWGCIDCKKVLLESMEAELAPIRSRADELRAHPARLDDALAAGAAKCRTVARETMRGVRDRMGFARAPVRRP